MLIVEDELFVEIHGGGHHLISFFLCERLTLQ